MTQDTQKSWGEARQEFVRIRDDVLLRLGKGEALSAIHRDLQPQMAYSTLAYHIKKLSGEPAPVDDGAAKIEQPIDNPPNPAVARKLAQLKDQAERAGHTGRKSVYNPTANSHEELFGPKKE